jgi:hypothetical protein
MLLTQTEEPRGQARLISVQRSQDRDGRERRRWLLAPTREAQNENDGSQMIEGAQRRPGDAQVDNPYYDLMGDHTDMLSRVVDKSRNCGV